MSNLAPFVLGGYFAQQLFSNFFFYFCIELPRNELSKDDFARNRSKGPFYSSFKVGFGPFHKFIYVIQ